MLKSHLAKLLRWTSPSLLMIATAGLGGGSTTAAAAVERALPGTGDLGFWRFDDCAASSFLLADSSGNGFSAVRSPSAPCALGPGDDGGVERDAVAFNAAAALVSVPHQAAFEFELNLTISAWVRPDNVTPPQIVVQKAGFQHQSFTLRVAQRRIHFTVEMRDGRIVTSSAPLAAGRWSHVTGLFDGQFISLFVDGLRVAQVPAAGSLRNVTAPIRIGNNSAGTEFFRGRIDEVRLSSQPLSESDIAGRACLDRDLELVSIEPPTSGPVSPDTPVDYQVRLKNHDFGNSCPVDSPSFFLEPLPTGFSQQTQGISLAPGSEGVISVMLTGDFEAQPGVYEIGFSVLSSTGQEAHTGAFVYELVAPTGCFVRPSRELLIKGLSVVDDPIRTTFSNPRDPRSGAWTFGKLMRDMAPTAAAAPDLVERLFNTWLTDQTVNGFIVPARPAIRPQLLDVWPRTGDGKLNLERSPLTLQAIVNRIDLRDLAIGQAGEARFVFAVNGTSDPIPQQFTVIVEFRLPATTEAEVRAWADLWHSLGSLPFPSEAFNARLQSITNRFARRNAAPGRQNGSAFAQLRTNEIALNDVRWELREFRLGSNGFFREDPVSLTPDNNFNLTPELAAFVNQNEAAILREKHVVPRFFQGAPFRGGSSFNDLEVWSADGITNNEARHKFSLNTCNGCHGPESGTFFLQITPRLPGGEADLSDFLKGSRVLDLVTGEFRQLNDLRRRRLDLEGIVCAPPGAAASGARTASPSTSLREGIHRVH